MKVNKKKVNQADPLVRETKNDPSQLNHKINLWGNILRSGADNKATTATAYFEMVGQHIHKTKDQRRPCPINTQGACTLEAPPVFVLSLGAVIKPIHPITNIEKCEGICVLEITAIIYGGNSCCHHTHSNLAPGLHLSFIIFQAMCTPIFFICVFKF